MCDTCDDSRFELIEKYKQKLLDATNIKDSPEEMAVIDSILFRFWQMGWLKGELFGNSEQLDLISRQDAVDAIRASASKYTGFMEMEMYTDDDAIEAIEGLPSAQPEQRWISCDERLPEDEEEVIVSVRDDSGDNTFDYSSCGWYACAGDFWVVDNEANERVAAWMPLPAPYRQKGEEHG